MSDNEGGKAASKSIVSRHVRDIDAEALYFFLTLCRTGSLQQTAERLAVSLSSANRILAKLRRYWDEPLFVRAGLLMKPTAGALARYDGVVRILDSLEALHKGEAVSAETLSRTVRIATYDNAFAVGIGATLDVLSRRLPKVRFQASQADEAMFDDLRDDKLDLVFFARQGVHPDIHSIPLFTTPYVCVVRKGHPLEALCRKKGALAREDLVRWKFVLVNAQPNRNRAPNSPANGWFNPPSADMIAAVLPFFLAVPLCLKETDFYSIVPEVTARLAFDLSAVNLLPFTADTPALTVRLGWHERLHRDPAWQLIRSVIKEATEERLRMLGAL